MRVLILHVTFCFRENTLYHRELPMSSAEMMYSIHSLVLRMSHRPLGRLALVSCMHSCWDPGDHDALDALLRLSSASCSVRFWTDNASMQAPACQCTTMKFCLSHLQYGYLAHGALLLSQGGKYAVQTAGLN